MSASGILQSDKVIFYHPLNDKIEYTQAQTWSGDANFASGIVSGAITPAVTDIEAMWPEAEFGTGRADHIDMDSLTSEKLVLAYQGGPAGQRYGKVRIAIPSGVSGWAFSSETTFTTNTINHVHVAALNSSNAIVTYEDETASGYLKSIALYVDEENNITLGNEETVTTHVTTFNDVERLANDKWLVIYYDNLWITYMKIGYISGPSGLNQSLNEKQQFLNTTADFPTIRAFSAQKVVVAYKKWTDEGYSKVCTIDNNDVITFGLGYLFGLDQSNQIAMDILDYENETFVIGWRDQPDNARLRIGKISGTNVVTYGPKYSVEDGIGAGYSDRFGITRTDATHFRFYYADVNTNQFKYVLGQASNGVSGTEVHVDASGIFYNGAGNYIAAHSMESQRVALAYRVYIDVHDRPGKIRLHAVQLYTNLQGSGTSYPSASGLDSITACSWISRPAMVSGNVAIERGYSIGLLEDRINFGSGTATWQTANVSGLLDTLNDGDFHFLVTDFRNEGGTTWRLRTSLDGGLYVDQGTQTSGSQSIISTDTDPQIELNNPNGYLQAADETVLWGNTDLFTTFELWKLYRLGLADASMPQYDDFILSENNTLTCSISGPIPNSSATNLFIEATPSKATSGDLFICGYDANQAELDLFIKVPEPHSSGTDLFIKGPIPWSSDSILFEHGYQTNESGTYLFIDGVFAAQSGMNLFLKAPEPVSSGLPISMTGMGIPWSSGTNLYVYGHAKTQTHLFVMDNGAGEIIRTYIDGTIPESIVTGIPGGAAIATDPLERKIYWARGTFIKRSDFDGSNIETIVSSGVFATLALAIDPNDQKIYWANGITGVIRKSDFDGSNIETIVSSGLNSPQGIDLDLINSKIYWVDSALHNIKRANLDGSEQEILISGLDTPYSIAIQPNPGKMYVAEGGPKRIFKADLNGSGLESIITNGLEIPYGLSIDLSDEKIYWVDLTLDTVSRANLDGSTVEELFTVSSPPTDTALGMDLDSIPLFIHGHDTANSDLDLFTYSVGVTSGITSLFVHGDRDLYKIKKIYWTDLNNTHIRRCDPDGSNIEVVVSGLDTPYGLAIDSENGKIYWSSAGADKIQRAGLNGSGIEDLITGAALVPSVYTIDLDVAAGKMYWGDSTKDSIQRANMEIPSGETPSTRTDIETIIPTASGVGNPYGVALDTLRGKLYWTQYSPLKIRRANIDGSTIEDLITTNLTFPQGIIIDPYNPKIYWADAGNIGLTEYDKIERSNLDGTGRETILNSGSPGFLNSARNLEIDGDAQIQKLYWVDAGDFGSTQYDRIARSNLDGTSVETIIDSGNNLIGPYGLALYKQLYRYNSCNLFIKAPEPVQSGMDLYLRVIEGQPSGELTLYIKVPEPASSGTSLFICNSGIIDTWSMYLEGLSNQPSEEMTLAIYGSPSGQTIYFTNNALDLSIKCTGADVVDPPIYSQSYKLYLEVSVGAIESPDHWPLFLAADTTTRGNRGLYTYGHASGETPHGPLISDSMTMTMWIPATVPELTGAIPINDNWSLFLKVKDGAEDYIPMSISGSPQLGTLTAASGDLVLSGMGFKTASITLYMFGVSGVLSSGIEIAMPYTYGVIFGNPDLYTHGY